MKSPSRCERFLPSEYPSDDEVLAEITKQVCIARPWRAEPVRPPLTRMRPDSGVPRQRPRLDSPRLVCLTMKYLPNRHLPPVFPALRNHRMDRPSVATYGLVVVALCFTAAADRSG